MDHTIVRYKTENFERFTFDRLKEKLIELKHYPKEVIDLEFDYHRFIHGLVIDKPKGNILKLNRFSKVKVSYHGTKPIDFKNQKKIYKSRSIDFSDPNILCLDTSFSVSHGILFAQLVDLKDSGIKLPDYEDMAVDIKEVLDVIHMDGTLKNEVKKNIDHFIIKDPKIAETLEKMKKYGKKLIVITNSDFNYSNFLLDETITPYLKENETWQDLFEYTITNSIKPRFFHDRNSFLKIDPVTGLMSNVDSQITPGIYQGGSAAQLEKDMGIEGDDILYFGDHIYGDVVSIKKMMNWRTALVLDEMDNEIQASIKGAPYLDHIEEMMIKKEAKEKKINGLHAEHIEKGLPLNRKEKDHIFSEIKIIDKKISDNIKEYHKFFNPYWGEINRAGQEESRFSGQVEKYACIYMTKISDLLEYSPRSYFRPHKRPLPHEMFF